MAAGSVYLHGDAFPPGPALYGNTPTDGLTDPGFVGVRVDVYPDQ